MTRSRSVVYLRGVVIYTRCVHKGIVYGNTYMCHIRICVIHVYVSYTYICHVLHTCTHTYIRTYVHVTQFTYTYMSHIIRICGMEMQTCAYPYYIINVEYVTSYVYVRIHIRIMSHIIRICNTDITYTYDTHHVSFYFNTG